VKKIVGLAANRLRTPMARSPGLGVGRAGPASFTTSSGATLIAKGWNRFELAARVLRDRAVLAIQPANFVSQQVTVASSNNLPTLTQRFFEL
jgi:hypothetical protein